MHTTIDRVIESKPTPDKSALEKSLIESGHSERAAHEIAELARLTDALSNASGPDYRQAFDDFEFAAKNLIKNGETEAVRNFAKTILDNISPSSQKL